MRLGLTTPVRASMRGAAILGWFGGAAALSAAILAAALAIGCSSQSPAVHSPPPAGSSAALCTRLAAGHHQSLQLSSSDTDTAGLSNAAKVLKTDPSRDRSLALAEHGFGQGSSPSTLRRLFMESPDSPRFAETLLPHTQERLLNAKAAEYSGFSSMMLTQLLLEMDRQEKVEPMVTLELSEEIKPVILTAVLDDKGQLRELIYHQHSGLAAIDNFVIACCKASLWGNNMPKGAMSEDGTYRLRIEAQLSKYSADREGNQTFVTKVGLGILRPGPARFSAPEFRQPIFFDHEARCMGHDDR